MRDFFHRAFFTEIPLKAISLVLAVTLFLMVRGEKDVQIAAAVRIVYATSEDKALVSEPVDTVRVILRGPWTTLKRFDERELEPIRIDLREQTDGIYRFDQKAIRGLPPSLEAVAFSPPSMELRFEKLVTIEAQVNPVIEGEPAYGYEVVRVSTNPKTVSVRAPASEIANVKGLTTRPVSVANRSTSLDAEIVMANLPRNFELLSPRNIGVQVEIAPRLESITLTNVPVEIENVANRAFNAEILPKLVNVVLRGSRLALDRVDRSKVVAVIDGASLATLATGSVTLRRPVATGIPAGVAVEISPSEVSVKVGDGPTRHR